jgi:amino acid transporter
VSSGIDTSVVAPRERSQTLKRGAMGVPAIVFLVVATAAPLSGTVGNGPLAIVLGNGIGTPGAFVAAGLLLVLFAIGFSAMGQQITNAGAFFAYITTGLGPQIGMAAGLVAMLSYNILQIYVAGFVGYFGHLVFLNEFSANVPWEVFALGLVGVVLVLGIAGIDFSARLLGTLLTGEIALLLILDGAVLFNHGFGAYTLSSLDPSNVFGHAAGVAFMFAFLSFIGFEATAIFGEEAKDPRRTVPRATFISICVLAAIYSISNWAVIGAFGADQVVAVAAKDPGSLFFNAIHNEVGGWAFHAMNWMVLLSVFAVLLALHNMCNRYFFAFGREGVLPRALSWTHPRFRTPYVAGLVQAGLTALVVAIYAVAKADPLLDLVPTMSGIGVVGVLALYVACAVAVVVHFRRQRDPRIWTTLVSPVLATVGLAAALVLVLENYHLLTGHTSGVVNQLPWIVPAVGAIGIAIGWLRPLRNPIDVLGEVEPRAGS